MVEDFSEYLGEPDAPYDLVMARRAVLEYHQNYGMPVIIKRAYNADHYSTGMGPQGEIVTRSSTYDAAYGQSLKTSKGSDPDEYGDGWFTYIRLDDTPIDHNTPGPRGTFKHYTATGIAPWAPNIFDGDLMILIAVKVIGDTLQITDVGDRFIFQGVQPITMRNYRQEQEIRIDYMLDKNRWISQRFQAVRMPRFHEVYDVPVVG